MIDFDEEPTHERIGPRSCSCCGEPYGRGCVLGPVCMCLSHLHHCPLCYKCPEHCKCTKYDLFKHHDEWFDRLTAMLLEMKKKSEEKKE
jgi:hypothetical protein